MCLEVSESSRGCCHSGCTVPHPTVMAAPADASSPDVTSASASASPAPSRLSLPGISQSCLRLAALRAEETTRYGTGALVHDPLAAKLSAGVRVDQAPFVVRKAVERELTRKAAAASGGLEQDTQATVAPVPSASSGAASPSPPPPVPASSVFDPSHLPLASMTPDDAIAAFEAARAAAPETMVRCRYIDQVVREHCTGERASTEAPTADGAIAAAATPALTSRPPIQQLVLLGAGLDTRAYRLACLAGVDVYELDVAAVLEYKAALLSGDPLCAKSITRVPVDFMQMGGLPGGVSKKSQRKEKKNASKATEAAAAASSPPAATQPPWLTSLLSASSSSPFRPSASTLWVAEGLLMYLGPAQVANLLGWACWIGSQTTNSGGAAAAVDSIAPSAASSLPSLPATPIPSPMHYLVADIMNHGSVRSKLKWYRFFRWGVSRDNEEDARTTTATGGDDQEKQQKRRPEEHPEDGLKPFLSACGWEIMVSRRKRKRTTSQTKEATPMDATPLEVASAFSPPDSADFVTEDEIHPIGRDGLSYGRYHLAPMYDSTSRPDKPPMLLEQYLIRAQMIQRGGREDKRKRKEHPSASATASSSNSISTAAHAAAPIASSESLMIE